jgi:alpha-amylase
VPKICWYLQLHQPYRLREFGVFEVGAQLKRKGYFSTSEKGGNKQIFRKVSAKSYLPMLRLLLKLTQRVSDFKVALSGSGIFWEQAEEWQPQIISLVKKLVATGRVEILAETYYHSLASLYDPIEFASQVALHSAKVKKLFGVQPVVFRNTELIYSDDIARQVKKMGYQAALTEGVPRYLKGLSPTQVVKSTTGLPLLLKQSQLSDDVAFRFSDRSWKWYPLTSQRYMEWLEQFEDDELINLFMDFETFGEHQWAETKIFQFVEEWVKLVVKKKMQFILPREAIAAEEKKKLPVYGVSEPISWADVDRDLTAWRGNDLQLDTLKQLYAMGGKIKKSGDAKLLEDWRRLQTSDHFYYMCTKWAADGDVHAYFSPFSSPFEAYRRYCLVLADLRMRAEK